jgi:sugar lactone lactonase YvrE
MEVSDKGNKLISPRLLATFSDFELDGLRIDAAERALVARPGAGTIAILSPAGSPLREVTLNGKDSTNRCFGGADGTTVYITQRDGGFIESFRVDIPGRGLCSEDQYCPIATQNSQNSPAGE